MTWSRCPFQERNLGAGRPATTFRSPTRFLRSSSRDPVPNSSVCACGARTRSQHLFAISLAVLLCWLGTCAAQEVDGEAIRVGDRWSYEIRDDLTGDLRHAVTTVVVDINDKEI